MKNKIIPTSSDPLDFTANLVHRNGLYEKLFCAQQFWDFVYQCRACVILQNWLASESKKKFM